MRIKKRWFWLILAAAVVILGLYFRTYRHTLKADRLLGKAGFRGGLIVHVSNGEGKFTTALYSGDSYRVHCISRYPERVENTRDIILRKGIYGRVSADRWDGKALPYSDNLVNLLVIDEGEPVPPGEIMRVLVPGGVAMTEKDGKWTRQEKPWPDRIDEWTHYMHGPDGNKVALDSVVGPPGHIQWLAGPSWGRDHRYGGKTAMVSARGRLFYVDNEIPQESVESLPDKPCLVARNAFNGVLLWKNPVYPRSPSDMIAVKADPGDYLHFEPMFPMELKMVAVRNQLYAAFGEKGEIQLLNAATGVIEKTYGGTEYTEEMLYSDDVLLTVAPEEKSELKELTYTKADMSYRANFRRKRAKILRALDPGTGEILWEKDTGEKGGLQVSPVISNGHVYAVIGDLLVKLDLFSGEQVWQKQLPESAVKKEFHSVVFISGPTVFDRLIATDEVVILVLCSSPGTGATDTHISTFSGKTGEYLWHYKSKSPEYAGTSAFVVGDRIWVHSTVPGRVEKKVRGRPSNLLFPVTALDLTTGTELARYNAEKIFDIDHHHRCYGNRATSRFLLTGRRGVEFTDFGSGEISLNHWVRGKCRFGVLPCNGLLYSMPHGCSCFPLSMLTGYSALAPEGVSAVTENDFTRMADRLEKGPVYENIKTDGVPQSADWTTFRHDGRRSGSTPHNVNPEELRKLAWSTSLGSEPVGLTAAAGRVFTCTPETHQVHALDAENGRILWSFTAGSRVDSPPTLHRGLVLFGCSDGYVYCLRAEDAELVWRFRAAPADRRMIDDNQLESIWPVHGAVLVKDDRLYAAAGRTSLLDGGLAVYALDPLTGRVLAQNRIHDAPREAEARMIGNRGHSYTDGLLGVRNEILMDDPAGVCLRQLRMDENLVPAGRTETQYISISGILNPNWFSRIGAYFGQPTKISRGQRGNYDYLDSPRQGAYIIFDRELTYSLRVHPNMGKFMVSFVPGKEGYRVFADDNRTSGNVWNISVPIRVQAMVACAGQTLYLAGPPDVLDPEDPWGAAEGRKGGIIWAVSARDGSKKAEYKIDAPPVFDGMIASGGRLYISSMDGRVICLGN